MKDEALNYFKCGLLLHSSRNSNRNDSLIINPNLLQTYIDKLGRETIFMYQGALGDVVWPVLYLELGSLAYANQSQNLIFRTGRHP